ncbi:hypothetical protein D210916BOD24_01600 [Alteromonas sp. D210916BOD_24]|uniref:cell envelope integrity protein TolA n=1 Tax=Alteromonas sp. D210916BOD_24 TaxID=3157618 RepID=UPI00399C6307
MIEQRIDSKGDDFHSFSKTSAPHTFTFSAVTLSLAINGLLLIALALSTDSKPFNMQEVRPQLLKAILLRPNKVLQQKPVPIKVESKPESPEVKGTSAKRRTDSNQVKTRDISPNFRNAISDPSLQKERLAKEVSEPAITKRKAATSKVQRATQDYFNHLNKERLHDIARQSSRSTADTTTPQITNPPRYYKTNDKAAIEGIEIVLDYNTIKGKVFSFLSRNKGVTVEDRDIPTFSNSTSLPTQGTVNCRDNSGFNDFIDRRVNK